MAAFRLLRSVKPSFFAIASICVFELAPPAFSPSWWISSGVIVVVVLALGSGGVARVAVRQRPDARLEPAVRRVLVAHERR